MFFNKNGLLTRVYNITASYSVYKVAKVLDKVIKSSNMKLKTQGKSSKLLKDGFPRAHVQEINRKMAILNKTYMTQISQIMALGKNSSKLQGLGIEVTKVRVDENLRRVKVYWIARSNEEDNAKIAKILHGTTGELQHEINSLGFMGKCPIITFVKDVTTSNYANVIATLDSLGLDVDNDMPHEISDLLVKDEQIHPPMTHDVFGLNHPKIMEKIKEEVKKKSAIGLRQHEKPPLERDHSDYRSNEDAINLIPFDKATFRKFYLKQMNMKRKLLKNSLPHQYAFNENDDRDYNTCADNDYDESWYNNEEKNDN